MIRLILVLFAVVAFLILSIPILIVEWLIGKKTRNFVMKALFISFSLCSG